MQKVSLFTASKMVREVIKSNLVTAEYHKKPRDKKRPR